MAKRVFAGAVFGVYMAQLLYFLNPQVDVTPVRSAAVSLLYAAICGAVFGVTLWFLRLLRLRFFGGEESARTNGFGFVVLAAFVAAAIYWMQRAVFFIYLPIGAQRVLAKATNLITGVAFVLLLLWVAERNATSRRSRIVFAAGILVIAISVLFLYQRRESYRAGNQRVVVANVGTIAGHRPVIVIAIRNVPYDWIVTLAGEGSLPFFESARTRTYLTRVEPFPVSSSQALWASMATGKLPFRHGVTGEFTYSSVLNGFDRTEPFVVLPSGVGFRSWELIPPVRRISALLPSGDALPLWKLFDRLGLRAAVIGWPNEPAELAPPSLMREAQRGPQTPTAASGRFQTAGKAAPRIIHALMDDLAVVAQLRAAARNPDVALTMATLRGFEEAQRAIHIFSNDIPARTTVKGEVVRAYVEELDSILGTVAREFPNHLLIVTSPSGPVAPRLPATPFALVRDFVIADDPGADDGFILMTGPGVTHREHPSSAQTVDLVPTCLYSAGLPVGRDMDGRVLSEAFDDEVLRSNALTLVQTYEATQLVVRRGGA